MAESFADLGRIEAIDQLYRLSAYKPLEGLSYVSGKAGARVSTAARLYTEGIDFNLVYFPLKHLGYKCVVGPNVTVVHAPFSEVEKVMFLMQIPKADIVFADLGVSSFQFDTPHRGFSMQKDGPMDMRMDKSSPVTALDFIKNATEGELRGILSEYAQEREAGTVARTLKRCADEGMTTTMQFAEEIRKAKRYAKKGIDPSTQVFMAIRMAVNDELGELETALKKSFPLLSDKGIMGIITFHSTEDRIVKNFFRDRKNNVPFYADGNDTVPVCDSSKFSVEMITPTAEECSRNPRARSAKLRILKKG